MAHLPIPPSRNSFEESATLKGGSVNSPEKDTEKKGRFSSVWNVVQDRNSSDKEAGYSKENTGRESVFVYEDETGMAQEQESGQEIHSNPGTFQHETVSQEHEHDELHKHAALQKKEVADRFRFIPLTNVFQQKLLSDEKNDISVTPVDEINEETGHSDSKTNMDTQESKSESSDVTRVSKSEGQLTFPIPDTSTSSPADPKLTIPVSLNQMVSENEMSGMVSENEMSGSKENYAGSLETKHVEPGKTGGVTVDAGIVSGKLSHIADDVKEVISNQQGSGTRGTIANQETVIRLPVTDKPVVPSQSVASDAELAGQRLQKPGRFPEVLQVQSSDTTELRNDRATGDPVNPETDKFIKTIEKISSQFSGKKISHWRTIRYENHIKAFGDRQHPEATLRNPVQSSGDVSDLKVLENSLAGNVASNIKPVTVKYSGELSLTGIDKYQGGNTGVSEIDFVDSTEEEQRANLANLLRLGHVSIVNIDLRRELMSGLVRFVQQVQESQKTPANWQKHNITLDDGNRFQISVREVDGVMQLKLGSLNTDLNRLLQQHLQSIRDHIAKVCDVQIELSLENDGNKEFEQFFGKQQASPSNNARNTILRAWGEPDFDHDQQTDSQIIRNFGYNRMEWTA
ncbi:MAG: hypothetical protein WD097_03745 [Balneolales bacterium]